MIHTLFFFLSYSSMEIAPTPARKLLYGGIKGNHVGDTCGKYRGKSVEITDLDGDAVGKVYGVEGSDVGNYMGFYFFYLLALVPAVLVVLFLPVSYLSRFLCLFFFSFLDQGTVKTTKEGRVVVGWGDRDICDRCITQHRRYAEACDTGG